VVKPERIVVRSFLTAIVVVGLAAGFPLLLLLKLAEGVQVGWTFAKDSIRNIWAAPGIKELD